MRLSAIITIAFAVAVRAHTTVHAAWVNEQDQGLGCGQNGAGESTKYIRCPPTNNPVKDLTSSAMTCNVNNNEVQRWIQAKPGDKITFEWHHNSRGETDDIIAASHKGPVQVYMAPAAGNGAGNVWVKLWADAGTTTNWGVDKLIAAKGKHYVYVPNVKPGKYLFKPEIITLHEADVAYTANPARGMQYYTGCVQVEVVGSGSLTLPSGVSFPGVYDYSQPGIVYNLYSLTGLAPYILPGPAVWSGYNLGGGFGGGGTQTLAPGQLPQTTIYQSATTPASPGTSTTAAPGAGVVKWGQCGGTGYTGSTTCIDSTCVKVNDYYSQCQ